jgi:ribosomal protein S18 acetylase RimI-like enzyme
MIRQAVEADFPAIQALMQSEPGFWQPGWDCDTLAQAVRAAGDLALVWEENGMILGFICAHDLGFRAYLSELVVSPAARGQGIGRKLVEHIQAELSGRGRTILIADVWKDAEPFYRALGWSAPEAVLLRRRLQS